jgi:dTDP-4-amino-4,6-dideoxygalactose transaminase
MGIDRLANKEVFIPFSNGNGLTAAHILPLLLPAATRTATMEALAAEGIQTSIHYQPIHHFTVYREQRLAVNGILTKTDEFAARELTLPLYPTLPLEAIDEIISTIATTLSNFPG